MIYLRLLKFLARRPLLLPAVVLLGLALALEVVGVWHLGARTTNESRMVAAEAERNPRQLIGRAWLDKYPEGSRDEVNLLVFFGSGFGVYEHGSRYKATVEFFEFERQGDSVELTFLHDKSRQKTRFALKACRDDESFDLCLDFENSPRGPARYYSWGDEDEDESRLSWLTAWKRGAEERARARR